MLRCSTLLSSWTKNSSTTQSSRRSTSTLRATPILPVKCGQGEDMLAIGAEAPPAATAPSCAARRGGRLGGSWLSRTLGPASADAVPVQTLPGSLEVPTSNFPLAAHLNRKDLVQMLLAKGADPSMKNEDGEKASDLSQDPEVKRMLK